MKLKKERKKAELGFVSQPVAVQNRAREQAVSALGFVSQNEDHVARQHRFVSQSGDAQIAEAGFVSPPRIEMAEEVYE